MDKRATHSPTGTVNAHPAVSVEVRDRAERPSTDRAGPHDTADLSTVFRAIAERIDVVLDEKVAEGTEPEGRHHAARAWSSVAGKGATEATSDLRRDALATTILRISADGRVDVDDREGGAIDGAAEDVAEDVAEGHAGRQDACDRQLGADRSDAQPVKASARSAVDVAPAHDMASEPCAPTATDRADVEDRLRAVRERLATRRANATAARVEAPGPRAPRVRPPVWRRSEVLTLARRILIGLAIAGASAIVSILVA